LIAGKFDNVPYPLAGFAKGQELHQRLLYLKGLYELLEGRIFAVPVVRAEVVKLADTPS
jgi:hypothetical protein